MGENTPSDDDERIVHTPTTEVDIPDGYSPGKIQNGEILNTVNRVLIDEVVDSVIEMAEKIRDTYPTSSDSYGLQAYSTADLYSMHVLAMPLFKTSADRLIRWHLMAEDTEHTVRDAMRTVPDTDDLNAKDRHDTMIEELDGTDRVRVLQALDLAGDDLYDLMKHIRSRRNDAVHNFREFMNISPAHITQFYQLMPKIGELYYPNESDTDEVIAAYQAASETESIDEAARIMKKYVPRPVEELQFQTLEEAVVDCESLVNQTQQMLERGLPYDQGFYDRARE